MRWEGFKGRVAWKSLAIVVFGQVRLWYVKTADIGGVHALYTPVSGQE
jgi:hypothetical protein